MAIVYDKSGKEIKCGKDDAVILVKSGHFTKTKKVKKAVK